MELLELLDEKRLDGLAGVRRSLGPKRPAIMVDGNSLNDVAGAIELACQLWGGACYPILPTSDTEPFLTLRWQRFLDACLIDSVWHRDLPAQASSYRGSDKRFVKRDLGEFLLAALDAAPQTKDDLAPVSLARLPEDHEWFIAYATALGLWPDAPNPHLLERFGYIKNLQWDQVLTPLVEAVDEPGPEDLLRRVRPHGSTTPARISTVLLGVFSAPRAGSIQTSPILPRPNETAEQLGPNIVVVYEPGNAEDMTLLWNLRMANGLNEGFPLGLPRTTDLLGALRIWQEKFAYRMWTMGHDRCALTSTSVASAELEALAREAGPLWSVVQPNEVLRDSDRPARTSLDVATFANGEATVSGWDATDRDALGMRHSRMHELDAVVRFQLLDRRIPPNRSLEPRYSFEYGYRGGGCEVTSQRYSSLAQIRWPTGWAVVEAMANDLDLRAKPSPAGRAATNLLNRIGSIEGMDALLSPKLIDFLYRLSERSGMTWFRHKLREIGAALDQGQRERLDQVLEELHFSGREEDRQQTTFSNLVQLLDRQSGEAWLSWAEQTQLLIRGARIICDRCGAKSWRTLGELSPHPVCHGCGQAIPSPFPASDLPFAYRASETVLQVMQHDAIVHLLAMRWFTDLWRPSHDGPSNLFGAYPGVEFFEKDGTSPIGEADLLLVQTDGKLVIGECKRHGAGLNKAEIEKLQTLAERLESPWTFLATLDRAGECPPIWKESERQLPDHPRFVFTAEHLFDPRVFWPAGANIFAWREESGEFHDKRECDFVRGLAQRIGWLTGKTTVEEEMMSREPSESDPQKGTGDA